MIHADTKSIELPAFYRLQLDLGRCSLVTLQGEVVLEVLDTGLKQIERVAKAHNEVRHWRMICQEAEKDQSLGGALFREHAEEKLQAARSEFRRAMEDAGVTA